MRRAAAAKLGDLAKVLEEGFLKSELLAIYEELTKDEQVRPKMPLQDLFSLALPL